MSFYLSTVLKNAAPKKIFSLNKFTFFFLEETIGIIHGDGIKQTYNNIDLTIIFK